MRPHDEGPGRPMSIDQFAIDLSEALEAEESAYLALLALAEAQALALEMYDREELDQVTAAQIEAAAQAIEVARERETAADALSTQLGLPPAETTLRELVAELPPGAAVPLEAVGTRLRQTVSRLEALGARNQTVLQTGIRVSQQLIAQLVAPEPPEPVYARNGRVDTADDRSAVEIQA